jgi:hypothetical protein
LRATSLGDAKVALAQSVREAFQHIEELNHDEVPEDLPYAIHADNRTTALDHCRTEPTDREGSAMQRRREARPRSRGLAARAANVVAAD